MIEAFFDGLCEPKNPGGVATFGFVVFRNGKRLHEGSGLAAVPYSDGATNNVAEYTGVLKTLEWLLEQGLEKEKMVVRGDSELVIKQLKGEYKVKSPLLAPLYRKTRDLSLRFEALRFEHVPREENREADKLTNLAYAEYAGQSMKAPTTDVMTVDLVFGVARDAVAAALSKAGIKAKLTALPGGTRVQVDLPAEAGALDLLLRLKSTLEGND
ncbi:MAG TPA: ribonuclease HI [Planctomycetota bacterium]|nr:ribonuclease HI [Planctomycetota bacterium]